MQTVITFLALLVLGVSALELPPRPVVGRDCRAHSLQVQISGVVSLWHPKCDADGSYSALQTYGSKSVPFCVDIFGTTIVAPTPELESCKCPRERTQLLQTSQGLVGQFIPTCDAYGYYSAMQFHASTGFVKCFSPDGQEIISGRQIRSCECHRLKFSIPPTATVILRCNDVTGDFL